MEASTLLNCPLCCEETFSSPHALKYHILSLTENLLCPACDKRFYNLYDLTDHLGRECKDLQSENTSSNVENQEDSREISKNSLKKDSEHRPLELLTPKVEVSENVEETYFCHMCNINILSVEEHLEQYHQGEEIIMDPEGDNDSEVAEDETPVNCFYTESEDDMSTFKDDDCSGNEIEYEKTNETIEEQQCLDKDGRIYTRKVIKINKFWEQNNENVSPLIQKYKIDNNGKIRKYEEDDEQVDKDSTMIIHQCPNCYLQFPQLDHYKKHICNPSSTKNKFKCIHCSKVFNSYEALNTHIKTHLKFEKSSGEMKRVVIMEPYKCEVCNTIFPSYRSLRLHQRMHEPVKDKAIEPPVNYTISGPNEKKFEKELVRRMFICNICNNTYDKEYEEVHMKSHSEVENYNCPICNRKFHTKENLEMHSKAHKQTSKFSCTYCKKAFTTYESLEDHVSNQCQKRQYECQYCGRRFARPHEKVKHERIHTGEKPHVCPICGKSFRISYCLTLHLRTHSGTRPYKCNHCGKRFKSHSVYNHHMLTHSNVRGYKCPYCPKAFKTSVQLAGHKNSHTKPFTCNECNRPFASLYAVRAHMESHRRENNLKYDCWQCGATYARLYALRDHMKTHDGSENKGLTEMETIESTTKIESQMEIEDEQNIQNQAISS